MELHHPLQGRELSKCREIQCCFDMSVVNYIILHIILHILKSRGHGYWRCAWEWERLGSHATGPMGMGVTVNVSREWE